ncbi:MAG: hypothetical protein ACR2RV_00525 [Verrucomicrobiales bacterium]
MRAIFSICAVAATLLPGLALGIPRVGEQLPDVVGYDESGKEFSLRGKLEGKPAVIVFGCLT